jgi:hypothetical protein
MAVQMEGCEVGCNYLYRMDSCNSPCPADITGNFGNFLLKRKKNGLGERLMTGKQSMAFFHGILLKKNMIIPERII